MTQYRFEINGKEYPDNTILTSLPTWKIDQIMVNFITERGGGAVGVVIYKTGVGFWVNLVLYTTLFYVKRLRLFTKL